MPLTKEDLEKQAEDIKAQSMQLQGAYNLLMSQIAQIDAQEQKEPGKNEKPKEAEDAIPAEASSD